MGVLTSSLVSLTLKVNTVALGMAKNLRRVSHCFLIVIVLLLLLVVYVSNILSMIFLSLVYFLLRSLQLHLRLCVCIVLPALWL